MKKFIRVMLYLTLVFLFVNNKVDSWCIPLIIIDTVAIDGILSKYGFVNNLSKYLVLATFWISTFFMPAFHLASDTYLMEITSIDYVHMIQFGSIVMLISVLSFFGVGKVGSTNAYAPSNTTVRPIPDAVVTPFFVMAFAMSIFAYSIGLGRMGGDEVRLPFHLAGIINIAKSALLPGLFAIYVENKIRLGTMPAKIYFVLFFIWSVLEVFVLLSKSILVWNFVPVFFIIYLYKRPPLKQIIRYAVPIFAIFMVLYPLIGAMRYTSHESGSFSEMVKSARVKSAEDAAESNENPLIAPLNRSFKISQYAEDYYVVSRDQLFDFSKVPVLLAVGGSQVYQTFIVEGYPKGINHSSGTTGLTDPLLHGGYGLCFIMIVVLFFFARYIDKFYATGRYSVFIFLFTLLWLFTAMVNISNLYNAVGMQNILVKLIVIYLAIKYNHRKV